jgi:hypothetical protein
MAFKLSKADAERRAAYIESLTDLRGKLEDAISGFNAAVDELKAPVTTILEAYNAELEEARGFIEDIARGADEEIDDKSEKWRDGERGQAATQWKDEYENADLSNFEITFPEELPGDLPDHPETLDGLPEEADAG